MAIPFVDVHPQTIAATLAARSVPEAVTQAVVVILGLIDNWTKPGCGGRAETEYQEVQ